MNEQNGPGIDTHKLKPGEILQSVDEKIKPGELIKNASVPVKPFAAFFSKFSHDWTPTLAKRWPTACSPPCFPSA
jgi:hypothetical protein